jgi:nitrogen regulatory protein PII
MTTYIDHKKITVILPKGKGLPLLKSLKEEKNVVAATLNFARGVGKMTPLRFRGVGEQSEKEIIIVVVSAELSEDIYEYLFNTAGINNPHSGIIYMNKLSKSNLYTLPQDLEDEK